MRGEWAREIVRETQKEDSAKNIIYREKKEQRQKISRKRITHTPTHTHTHRERERESKEVKEF